MKLLKKKYETQNCYLSNHCLKEWIPAIEASKEIYEVKKGELLFEEGDHVEGMYFVYKGLVKVHKKWGDKELILRFASDGAVLGHRGLSTGSRVYPISATALEHTIVCYISMDFFYSTLRVNPDFTINMLMFFADELQESERKMRNLAHMSVKGRLSRAILSLKAQFGTNSQHVLNIELSKQDLASYVGVTYETLFRIMNELIEEGSISVFKRSIQILEEQKLILNSKKEE